jgi:transcriptional regulator with XRE-family HTH domain
VRQLRTQLGMTLDQLAAKCDVSRSMLSLVERGESSPTAVVLEKIATGSASLWPACSTTPARPPAPSPGVPTARPGATRSPGYLRKNISPANLPLPRSDRGSDPAGQRASGV